MNHDTFVCRRRRRVPGPVASRGFVSRRILIALAGIIALVPIALIAVALLDDTLIRTAAMRAASAATGRDVRIASLQIHPFSLAPRVQVSGVSIANARWGAAEHFATLERGEIAIGLPSLLLGRIVLEDVHLVRPEAYLERAVDGRVNWRFDERPEGPGSRSSLPAVRAIEVERGFVEFREGGARSLLEVEVDHARGEETELPVSVSAKGRWRGAPVTVEARAGAVRELTARSRPYPLKVDVRSGRATFAYDGEMRPFDPANPFAGRVSASGRDLWDLRELAGMPLPHTRPYAVTAHLARRQDGWHLTDMAGRMGASDIRGTISFTQRNERPFLEARLESKLLDLVDLGGVVGASPHQKKPPPKPGEALPATPFDFGKLARFDADVSLRAGTLKQTAGLPLDHLDVRARLDRGRVAVAPLDFGVAKGRIAATAKADFNQRPMSASTELSFRQLHIADLLPRTGGSAGGGGIVEGRGRFSGRGDAIDSLLATLDGEIGLITRGGEVSNLLLEIAGLDAAEAARFLVGGDRKVGIRCGLASLVARKGIVSSEALLLDTEDTKITGEARVDLREETMRIDLYPQPKDASIVVLRAPLHIKGPLAKPSVGVDKGVLAVRAGSAVLLGMINPLLAVIPLIETGGAQDTDCNALVSDVNRLKPHDTQAPKAAKSDKEPTARPDTGRSPR